MGGISSRACFAPSSLLGKSRSGAGKGFLLRTAGMNESRSWFQNALSLAFRFIRQMSTHLFKNSFIRGLRKMAPKGFLRFQGSRQSLRKPFEAFFSDESIVHLVIRTHLPDEPVFNGGKKALF
jgi:hypothetical protein